MQALFELVDPFLKTVAELREAPDDMAIPGDGTVAEDPGVASDLAPDVATEVSQVEVSQVDLGGPPLFDLDGQLFGRVIAGHLELDRVPGLRGPRGAGEVRGGLDPICAGARDDVANLDAGRRRGTLLLDTGHEDAGFPGGAVVSPQLRRHFEQSNSDAALPAMFRESPDESLVPAGEDAVVGDDDPFLLLLGRLVAGGRGGGGGCDQKQGHRHGLQSGGVHWRRSFRKRRRSRRPKVSRRGTARSPARTIRLKPDRLPARVPCV